jgi:hypothetical protein
VIGLLPNLDAMQRLDPFMLLSVWALMALTHGSPVYGAIVAAAAAAAGLLRWRQAPCRAPAENEDG